MKRIPFFFSLEESGVTGFPNSIAHESQWHSHEEKHCTANFYMSILFFFSRETFVFQNILGILLP